MKDRMKTVYTATFHTAMNYGAILQAYALQQVLLRKYNTAILDYDPIAISNDYNCFKRVQGSIKQQGAQFIKDIVNFKKNYKRNSYFKNFSEKYLIKTAHFNTKQSVINHYPPAEAYIVGSDQIWNPIITKGLDPIYTLDINNEKIKKIAYAASAGNNNTLKHELYKLATRLKEFDAISVREEQLKQLLTSEGVNNIAITLDPSLLLTKSDWQKIIPRIFHPNKKYILAYSWDEPELFFEAINQLARQTGYMIYYYHRHDYKKLFHAPKKSYFDLGPLEFLALIQNAECVFTTSFHGTAFSSILNKKFYTFLGRYPERITNLLNSINLSNRIVSNMQNFNQILCEEIDWAKANKILDKNRKSSLEWLYNAID